MNITQIIKTSSYSYDHYTINFTNENLFIRMWFSNIKKNCGNFYIGTDQDINDFIGKEVDFIHIDSNSKSADVNEEQIVNCIIYMKDKTQLIITAMNNNNGYYKRQYVVQSNLLCDNIISKSQKIIKL